MRVAIRPRHGFALVLVLVILSLMTIIAVGYLSSMASDRATANAFSNKVRAEAMAQAGVDAATGVLRDYFKAFPDSVTVWDTAQSMNSSPSITNQGFLPTNEGTTLYLRAVPQVNDPDTPNPAPGLTDPNHGYADFNGGNGPNNVDATTGVDNRKIFVLPLVSGAAVKQLVNKASALPTPIADNSASANSVDLNSRRKLSDTEGWLGSPPNFKHPAIPSNATPALPKPCPVPWVEIRQSDGYTDPATAPVVGRYAYWVEDESFRANVNYAGLGPNKDHVRRDNPSPPATPLNPTDADLLGPLNVLATPAPLPALNPNVALAKGVFDTRAFYPGQLFPDARGYAHDGDLANKQTTEGHGYLDGLGYLTTTVSSALNLSRHGTQRLSLNDLIPYVTPSPTTPPDVTVTQKQIDSIVKTIHFHAPNFGQRFYRLATTGIVTDPAVLNAMSVTHDPTSTAADGNHAKIYEYKAAANILDYIDADCFPTCVMNTGQVRAPSPPAIPFGDNGDNVVWAIGKDAAPFMQECDVRFRRTDSGSGTPFTMAIDYYVEVWNMSTKDVKINDLGSNPFIRISNPTRWEVNNSVTIPASGTTPSVAAFSTGADLVSDDTDGVSPSNTRPNSTARDYKIDLTTAVPPTAYGSVLFPAGQVTVITTDPNYTDIITDTEALNHIVKCSFLTPGKRLYKGHFPTGRPSAGKDVLNMVFDTIPAYGSASSSSDYETDITIGSDWGYIDCLQGALPLSWGGRISAPYTGTSANYPYVFGGVMRGNWTNTSNKANEGMQASALGDPRTNNEQLVYTLNPSSNTVDRSRYAPYDIAGGYNSLTPGPTATNPANGIIQTIGLANYRSVRPNRPENPWADLPLYYTDPNNPAQAELATFMAAKAPMPIANGPLSSIGQLGDVFDSYRFIESGNTGGSRGGGRSFKIGQHDDRWDGDQASASRTWAAWRLADIFSATNNNAVPQPGLININGVARDNGAALRAALTGFKFQPDSGSPWPGDPALADSASVTTASRLAIDNLVAEIKARLNPTAATPATGIWQTGSGPFWERGELSELPGFGRSPDQFKPDRTRNSRTYPPTSPDPADPNNQTDTDLTGIALSSKASDRGREELFRRLVEMTTTRGNVFTVYALGQSINQTGATGSTTKQVTGTHQLKVTFRLVPKGAPSSTGAPTDFHPGTDNNNQYVPYDLTNASALEARFAKPDHYEVQIISVRSGNG